VTVAADEGKEATAILTSAMPRKAMERMPGDGHGDSSGRGRERGHGDSAVRNAKEGNGARKYQISSLVECLLS
jgi:hypothetical protein